MAELLSQGDKATPESKSACSWMDEHIWSPISDIMNTRHVSVRPDHFLGMPQSFTIPQISICDQATGKMVAHTGETIEHYSEASRKYEPPR